MGIDIPDWAISAEILTPSRAASATTIAQQQSDSLWRYLTGLDWLPSANTQPLA